MILEIITSLSGKAELAAGLIELTLRLLFSASVREHVRSLTATARAGAARLLFIHRPTRRRAQKLFLRVGSPATSLKQNKPER